MTTSDQRNVSYRAPPMVRIYLIHAIGTALLGALLPSGEHMQGLHAIAFPIIQQLPGAIKISQQAPDPVLAQVFLALSLLIAVVVLTGSAWHVSHGKYHTKTFDSSAKKWRALIYWWVLTAFVLLLVWSVPYTNDGAQGRIYFLIKAATSTNLGVFTVMNFLIVGMPLACLLTSVVIPFCIDVKTKYR